MGDPQTSARRSLFVPGYATRGRLYRPGMPEGWEALEPPSLRRTAGSFGALRDWLVRELAARDGAATLAGHSMGGALAVAAAAERPDLVERLLLIGPAGLPMSTRLRDHVRSSLRHVVHGLYPVRELAATIAMGALHPRALFRLGREVHDLDLSRELDVVRSAAIPVVVVGCVSDTAAPPAFCRVVAERLGGSYRELDYANGHVWMLRSWPLLAELLAEGVSDIVSVPATKEAP